MHCARCFFYESDVGDDTCNRCGRAYLPEANVYLGLVLLVTGGGAWTLRNLLTGQADLFVRPAAGLGLWATWPVSLVNCPAYGFVIGAWLAMLAVAPILTGILYGKRGGWLTAIVIALLGPDTGLAAAAALGVWIAAGWTLRLQSKLASALLGLLPPAAYWFATVALPGAGRAEPAAALASPSAATTGALAPALRSLAYVPPITAVVIAAGAAALLVAVGRADRWHVRWPAAVLAILVTAPVVAVPAFVGMDEIRYGLLQDPNPPSFGSSAVPLPQMDRLQTFLARHPASPHATEVRARLATDIERLSSGARSGATPRRSEEIWQELLSRNPDSVWAADARVHLGDAAARQGLFVQAEEAYRRAIAQATLIAAPAGDPLAEFNLLDLFSIGKAFKARADAEHLRAVRDDALMHLALILENRKDTQDNSRALALYFVARAAGTNSYRQRLRAVLEADPGGPLADNVAYDLAMAEVDNPKDMRRVEQLQKVIESYPKTDGALLARVAAARSLISRAASEPAAPREARRYLEEAQGELARREATNPLDPYVAALSDTVKKELGYVRLQLRAPEKGR